jgi:hypothetical protein
MNDIYMNDIDTLVLYIMIWSFYMLVDRVNLLVG